TWTGSASRSRGAENVTMETRSPRNYWPWLAMTVLALAAVVGLRVQGHLWWCKCGQPWPWSGNAWSGHNSQHLFGPYSFTHVLHGVLWCGLLGWCWPRLAPVWRLALAVTASVLWEVIENTIFVIQRFREATVSLEYDGDTVANALGDILSCAAGFALAH